jgi:hypothetical protein
VYDPLDTVAQRHAVEIEQKAYPPVAQLQVGEQLRSVNRSEAFNRFDLDDHLIVDKQVNPVAGVQPNVFVLDRQSELTHDVRPSPFEFVCETNLVRGLQQSRPEFRMYFERSGQDAFGQRFTMHHEDFTTEYTEYTEENRLTPCPPCPLWLTLSLPASPALVA